MADDTALAVHLNGACDAGGDVHWLARVGEGAEVPYTALYVETSEREKTANNTNDS